MTDTRDQNEGNRPPRGGKDLDELKAKLGLTSKPDKPGVPKEAAPRKAVDEFSLSLGTAPTGPAEQAPSLSPKELAEIEHAGEKAARPLGRTMLFGGILVFLSLFGLFLGYQYGKNNSARIIHNQQVEEGQRIVESLQKELEEAEGTGKSSRMKLTEDLRNDVRTYMDENMGIYAEWKEALANEGLPQIDFAAFKEKDLATVKAFCLKYLRNAGSFDVSRLLRGQLYSFDMGATLLEFAVKTERLRVATDNLRLSVEALEQVALNTKPLDLGPTQLYVEASKAEAQKTELDVQIRWVELLGNPFTNVIKEFEDAYQPVSMEFEYDCLDEKGRPAKCTLTVADFEGKQLLVKADEQTQIDRTEVRQKVKDLLNKEEYTPRLDSVFIIDLETKYNPIIEWVAEDQKLEARNFEILLDTFLQNLQECRDAADELTFDTLLEQARAAADSEAVSTF